MRSARQRGGWLYAGAALLALAGFAWVSRTVLEHEAERRDAALEAEYMGELRLALWRVDSWFGLLLAQEAARPYRDYVTGVGGKEPVRDGSRSMVRGYFQVEASGVWSNSVVSVAPGIDPELLESLRRRNSVDDLAEGYGQGRTLQSLVANSPPPQVGVEPETRQSDQALLNRAEFEARNWFSSNAVPVAPFEGTPAEATVVGPLVPIWLDADPADPRLAFVREVVTGSAKSYQGFLLEWPQLERDIREQLADLFPEATLAPRPEALAPDSGTLADSGLLLASMPVSLELPAFEAPPERWASPLRLTLLVAWVTAIVALVAGALTLRASLAYGEKRSRFASTVTHELRTPLTTFRMYSEMLAKDMVPPEKRGEYLATLESEAGRLANLVENVLAYARIEDGHAPRPREVLGIGALVDRLVPVVEARLGESGGGLELLRGGLEGSIRTDPAAVEQILVNLADNAVKYAGVSAGAPATLEVRCTPRELFFELRDRGPGVPGSLARAIFEPFDRGNRDAADPTPGVGLGLALARGLAQDLGGDLTLEPSASGAAFRLRLPRSG